MRLVQVGLGTFGRSWLPVVMGARGVTLVAVVDPLPATLARAAAAHDLPPGACFASLADAVAGADVDAALVVTPPPTHHAVVAEALAAGKHVLVEKPLATTLADAHALVAAAAAAGRVLMVSQNYRFRPPARAAQAFLAAGRIGAVLAVKVTCRRDTRRLFPTGDFRYAMRHPYVLDMAIHHLDLLRALTGQNVVKVFARSWRVPDSPYRHDPATAAVLDLSGGGGALYQGDWAPHDRETSWNGEWEITGENGRLLWRGGETDATTGELLAQLWGEPLAPIAMPELRDVDRAGTLQAFREAVAAGTEPETSGRDNVRSLATVLACVESIERGEAVPVPSGS